ncbi:MAG TPA: YncE family protein [Terriglobales bacterium]|nr:YncE family protein [Terriglobales bacterium]
MKSLLRTVLVLLFTAAIAFAAGAPQYKVLDKIKLGGEGGWDYLYVDSSAHRLYISRGTHVMVLDTNTNKVVGDIPNTQGVHGVAISDKDHKGYTSNGGSSTVTPFDPKTLQTSEPVKVGTRPDAIIFDPASDRVFTFNAGSKDATAVDAKSGKVDGTVEIGGKPEFAQPDGKGTIFVNNEDTAELFSFDSKTLQKKNVWKMDGCESPSGLAFDVAHRRLFSGCRNKVITVTDADSGKTVAHIPIGPGVDANRFDPASQLVFSSNGGDGTLTIAHEDSPDQYTVVQTLETQRGARTMELDPKTHKIYLVTAEFEPAPAPVEGQPRQRPKMIPGTFTLIVVGQ